MKHRERLICTSFVIKIASRCNLNCKYCYMYNKGDTSYLKQPKIMSRNTVIDFIERVYEHYTIHNIKKRPIFSFHGGEPLLVKKSFFNFFIEKANSLFKAELKPLYTVQTNGILIDDEWCDLFEKHNIYIGISLDGEKSVNDENRIYHSEKGSYDDVIRGLDKVLNYKNLKRRVGILSVINIKANPISTYHHLKSLGVKNFDFLLPDYTYDDKDVIKKETMTISYSDWLISIFNEWFIDKDRPRIRFFNGIIESIMGGDFSNDSLGELNNELLVIETNGEYEAVDVLKTCGENFTKTGTNVSNTSIDDALKTDLAYLYIQSHSKLSQICDSCAIKKVCGGGYLPHRFSKHNGFDNPSVYCGDLMKLITHIQNTVIDTIPQDVLKQMNVVRLSFEDAQKIILNVKTKTRHLKDELFKFNNLNNF